MELKDSIDTLKGVGPKKKELFFKYGIETIEDLLLFYPKSFEDRRTVTKIEKLRAGETFLVTGQILSSRSRTLKYKKQSTLSLTVSDETGIMDVTFFNSYYNSSYLKKGDRYTFYGKVTDNFNGRYQMLHPEMHREGSAEDIRGIIPVYPSITGISQNEIRKLQMQIKPVYEKVKEWLPEELLKNNNLAGLPFAIQNLHFPCYGKEYLMAKYRLIFDEFLTMEAGLFFMRGDKGIKEECVRINTDCVNEFVDKLPFSLTDGQILVWEDIAKDLSSPKAMNRLIQGDVGSGKTVIAEMAMYAAAKNDYQSVMMAPTEILAKQHYISLQKDFNQYGINIGLLCSSMKQADKVETLNRVAEGKIHILVGTHAVIEPGVKFKNLGIVITDEQHRFGVNQRKILTEKGKNPNVMVMTATPIPRTLAVILYGDFDISQIKTMPKGRKIIKTIAGTQKNRKSIYEFIKGELKSGHQAYVVAPLIEESEKIDALSAEELYDELKEVFSSFNLALIHGAMKQNEKDLIMEQFSEGKIDMLISTVVIEVGINVPNATVMVIENSERFGLAQMHQLRGRVGRGNDQSYCFVISHNESQVSKERCQILCNCADGFKIAEEDLRLRGPGEIFGTRQHGLPEMHFGDIIRHADVLEKAKDVARSILKEDPALSQPKYLHLKERLVKMFGRNISLNL